ncbi:globin-like [Pollicipes pollicipes]|uniref:globin-like n=1 Tax=Pollicipes pollicipes TaxID=41117 RepID=UPI0018859587|nr:globin-like [Pollicipes pollicipes]
MGKPGRYVGRGRTHLTACLFENHPELKQSFQSFRGKSAEELRTSKELRQHASRVMGFINKIIVRLDSEETYTVMIQEMCCRHMLYQALPREMKILGRQFISVIASTLQAAGRWDDQAQTAWENLFTFIASTYELTRAEAGLLACARRGKHIRKDYYIEY